MADESDEAPAVEIPHDLVNEQIVIAAAMGDDANVRESLMSLPADLFLDDDHIEIWGALRDLHRQHIAFDVASAVHALAGRVEASYIRELVAAYPDTPVNLRRHIASLRWDSTRAQVVEGPLSELLRAMQDPTCRPERIRALSHAVARSLDAGADHDHFIRSTDAVVAEHMDEVERRRTRAIYPYGIDGLDADDRGIPLMIPGAAPEKVTVITGVSGSAKSVLLARIML
ncbi:MAG: DnaB-like helicase N-terminal domain-containing protein [Alphaproteobacteria bacterium]